MIFKKNILSILDSNILEIVLIIFESKKQITDEKYILFYLEDIYFCYNIEKNYIEYVYNEEQKIYLYYQIPYYAILFIKYIKHIDNLEGINYLSYNKLLKSKEIFDIKDIEFLTKLNELL